MFDVDDIHTRGQVRPQEFDGGHAKQRVHVLGRTGAAGAEGDGAIPAFAKSREKDADSPGQFDQRFFIGRQIELQSAGVDCAADFAGVQIRHDRLARFDRHGGLGLISASPRCGVSTAFSTPKSG